MNNGLRWLVGCAVLISTLGCPSIVAAVQADTRAMPADIVLLHGKIHTQNPGRAVTQALAIRGKTLVAVGSDASMRALIGPQTRRVDLRGHVVLPGIIDAHTHPAMSSQDVDKCSLHDRLLTPQKVKRLIRACLAKKPYDPATWFEVVMVNAIGLSLTLHDLDDVLANHPMLLSSSDGHTAWVNSAALGASHISAETADPAGGHIERDSQGLPTGTLRDHATNLAEAARPPAPIAFETAKLAKTLAAMRATGITSVQDASVDAHWMSLYKQLYDAHRLDMRVRGAYHLHDLHEPAATAIAAATRFRQEWAVDPDYLRADSIKIFADGGIEYPSQTAALLEPYLDRQGKPTDNRGPSYFTQTELDALIVAADAADLTVHVHAIGDRAVRGALDAFAMARRRNGDRDNRHQIAHLELVDPDDFPRFEALGVLANFQLLWAQTDDYTIAATQPYLGAQRFQYLYPARSLRDAGARIVGGSDWGVSSFNAFAAMEHAMTRAAHRGAPPLLPAQAIELQDMIDAYTINAAYALKQERNTGSLEVGKRADLIVLDRDLFALDPFDVHKTRVVATYLDGRLVYSALRTR